MVRGDNISISRKLSSQQGLSILIALAFVLICTMIAAVVISSASVNAERIKSYRTEQQSYLAKVSALNLVQDIIVGENDNANDGIRIQKPVSGVASVYTPISPVDGLGIANWMCKRLNHNNSKTKLTLSVDASALNSKSATQVKPVTLEVSFNGDSVRVRAYDSIDGSDDGTGAVTNISRTFSKQEDDATGVMSWNVSELS